MLESLFHKISGCSPETFLMERFRRGCFCVSFDILLRTRFLIWVFISFLYLYLYYINLYYNNFLIDIILFSLIWAHADDFQTA